MRRETPSCLSGCLTIALSLVLSVWGLNPPPLDSLTYAAPASSQTPGALQLFWNAPTTNRDSSPLRDLAGYKLHYGASSGAYTTTIDVGNQTTYTLQGLELGRTYYIAVTAYDAAGNDSTFSAELVMLMTPTGAKEQVSTPPVRPAPVTSVSAPRQEQAAEKPSPKARTAEKFSRHKKRAKEQTEASKVRRQEQGSTASPASQTPSLQPTTLVRGQPARFQVTGTSQGDVVFFLFSMEGTGPGPCAPDLGGICVDLLSPQVFGQVTADASGTANLVLPIPAGARTGQQVSIQAVIRHGAGQERHIKTEAYTLQVQ